MGRVSMCWSSSPRSLDDSPNGSSTSSGSQATAEYHAGLRRRPLNDANSRPEPTQSQLEHSAHDGLGRREIDTADNPESTPQVKSTVESIAGHHSDSIITGENTPVVVRARLEILSYTYCSLNSGDCCSGSASSASQPLISALTGNYSSTTQPGPTSNFNSDTAATVENEIHSAPGSSGLSAPPAEPPPPPSRTGETEAPNVTLSVSPTQTHEGRVSMHRLSLPAKIRIAVVSFLDRFTHFTKLCAAGTDEEMRSVQKGLVKEWQFCAPVQRLGDRLLTQTRSERSNQDKRLGSRCID